MTGRGSAESSMGAREAHTFAQAPTQEGYLNRAATTVDVFPAIVEALSCYKRIHGHLKMLPTFRVSSTAPWPENLWGMELGKLVFKLRNEKDVYKGQYPERVQLLKNMGFEWEHSAVADEWDQIITGIETFYSINGHSRVPTRFVIPAEEPWPMEIWGHKLGSRIAQMRMTGRWLGDTEETLEERRNILDKLGFEWRLRVHDDDAEGDGNAEEFSILCEGLEVYQELGGSVPNMPATFVIPNADPWPIRTRGFPLGSQVRVVRSRQKYAKDSQANADRLLALGVPINPIISTEKVGGRWGGPTETRFDKLCKALETFTHLYGHTQVPINFEVPRDEPWPISTWNVKLGMSLSNIVTKGTFIKGYPDRQARLEAMGFDTDPGGVRGFKELVRNGMSAADALAESQAALDFAEEPAARALPPLGALRGERNDDASQMDSQMLLGSVMDSLRSKETSRNGGVAVPPPPSLLEEEEEEEEGEEEVESSSAWAEEPKKPAWDPDGGEKKEQLPTFMRKEFTDEDRRLTTDDTDMRYWPEETQHQAVRKMIPMLGYLARGYDEVAVVDGAIGTEMVTLPGVLTPSEWDPKRKKEPEYGYVEREDDEYIDEEDEAETGMIDRQKGRRLTNGCSTSASALDWCTEEVREHILKVDFEWDEFGDGFRWDDVIAGLTLYKTLYGELPDDEFKVPVDYEWPIELSGMQLGSICKQMRIGDIWAKHDTKRKKALDELGFDWGDDALYLHFQWPEVLISFYSVMRLKGHLDVSPQYVIPEEDPWPMPIRGTPVGFYLNLIRAQKELLIEHYPDRFEILRGLGVMWSEPILVDWEKEEEKIEYPWREWGFVKADDELDEISVDPEFGLKDADPLL